MVDVRSDGRRREKIHVCEKNARNMISESTGTRSLLDRGFTVSNEPPVSAFWLRLSHQKYHYFEYSF
jgi:hypothetical protein